MVEGGAKEVSEEVMLEAIATAQPFITKICDAQLELRELAGKEKLPPIIESTVDLSWLAPVKEFAHPPLIKEASFVKGKMERYAALAEVHEQVKEKFADLIAEDENRPGQLGGGFSMISSMRFFAPPSSTKASVPMAER